MSRSLENSEMQSNKSRTFNQRRNTEPGAVFTVQFDQKIPNREKSIKPDVSRSYLSSLPKHYEQAKLKNVITRSLRQAAKEDGQ